MTTRETRLAAATPESLDPEERMSRDELESLQLRRLQHTVRTAYENVPTYRRKFDEVGVHPDDIKDLADVEKLPFPGMRRIEKITGRNDDMIILRGVNLFPTQVEEIVLTLPELSPHFIIELSRPARLDKLTVRVERRESARAEAADMAANELIRRVKTAIGCSIDVDVVDPGLIERSAGKFQRVHDVRNA
jgi:phenylacetate-coenzyme A ligase PaaK-like adenylate-forming protein